MADKLQLDDVYQLLYSNYVEDDEAMFRFQYSASFLNWALKAPGWRADWHIGIRATSSRKLVAFISGVPITLRIRTNTVRCSEINFMCVHKKLRSKRLAPVLIREITRRCNRVGIWQAIYTGGRLLPTPVATCRYFHRSLDWKKLHECQFSPLPRGSTPQRQVARYKLPERTSTKGLREMRAEDVSQVTSLLERYLARSKMAQSFDEEEVAHWLLDTVKGVGSVDRVVWTFVVEETPVDTDDSQNGSTKKITDFFSFYALSSTVIGNTHHDTIRAAYLFYYATEAAFPSPHTDTTNSSDNDTNTTAKTLQLRLQQLMNDALSLAKRENFDVMNALSLLDNPLFLEALKYGPGDGRLHYYLFNYRAGRLGGGVDGEMRLVTERGGDGDGEGGEGLGMGDVGVVML